MAKPKWGVKRACLACGTRFYDMCKDPILCPSCGAKFDVEAIFRPRRSRAVAEETPPASKVPASENGDVINQELAALADDSAADDDDGDDDAAIEDTSDLADDDSDVQVVTKEISANSN